MAINLDALVISVVVQVIVVAPVLWLAGRVVVGRDKAKFTDAIWIVVVGAVVGSVFGFLFSGLVGGVVQFIVWLLIVKYFFDTGWLGALAVSVIAVVFFFIIVLVLGVLGFAIFSIF